MQATRPILIVDYSGIFSFRVVVVGKECRLGTIDVIESEVGLLLV